MGHILDTGSGCFWASTLFSMGYFKNTTVWGGALWPPLATLVFLKIEGQNLVAWGILMCFLQKSH